MDTWASFHLPHARRWLIVGCLFELLLGVVAVGIGHILGIPVLASVQWEFRALGFGAAATIPLLIMFAWMLTSRLKSIQEITQFLDRTLLPLLGRSSVIELAVLSALAGIGEELLFRGVAQTWLGGLIEAWPGLLVASVIFGAAHCVTPAYAVIASLIGVYLGLLFMGSGNLLAPIVTHALYDFLALVYFLRVRGRTNDPGLNAESR